MILYPGFDMNLNNKEMLCIVGAGGKTTTLFQLAKELKSLGKKVLITTTTALYYPDKEECDCIAILGTHEFNTLKPSEGTITVIGTERTVENKLRGYQWEALDKLFEEGPFDIILVEGDGSKRKSLKAPATHEPVIPSQSTCVIGVIGLDAIGESAMDLTVHRIKEFCNLTGIIEGSIITEAMIIKLIINPKGLFKDTPHSSRRYVLLNKSDTEYRRKAAKRIAEEIINSTSNINGVIAASVRDKSLYRQWGR